jgi:hypothetical protein
MLIQTQHGIRTEHQLDTDDALLAAYRDHFGIALSRLPDDPAAADDRGPEPAQSGGLLSTIPVAARRAASAVTPAPRKQAGSAWLVAMAIVLWRATRTVWFAIPGAVHGESSTVK